jgi:hypothetical protein
MSVQQKKRWTTSAMANPERCFRNRDHFQLEIFKHRASPEIVE